MTDPKQPDLPARSRGSSATSAWWTLSRAASSKSPACRCRTPLAAPIPGISNSGKPSGTACNHRQDGTDQRRRVLHLQSRHQLFPQVYRYVAEYVRRKVDFQGQHPCELGLEKYVRRLVERLRDAIVPDDTEGEPPLLPLLNRYQEIGATTEVDFKTTWPCFATQTSHINQVVADAKTWETSVAFKLEQAVQAGTVRCYARNDGLGLTIPYEYMGVDHRYEPDFLVRLNLPKQGELALLLEIKGYEDDQTQAKHTAARRWIMAVNHWGQLGQWRFHVCRNPQLLDQEIAFLVKSAG